MRFIKSNINNMLGRVGLELQAVKYDMSNVHRLPKLVSSGHIVELIGTQGVGKSTLNNAVYKELQNRWFFRGDLKYTGPTSADPTPVEQLHREIYFRKIDHVRDTQTDPWRSLMVSRQMSTVIYESLVLASNVLPRGVFLDEGLFKNFPQEVLNLDKEQSLPLWEKRSFIHLRAKKPELAAERYLKRVEERRSQGFFQHTQTKEDIMLRIERDNTLFDQICETAMAMGCPVIVINAEDNFEESVQRIVRFEKSLNN